MSEIDHHHLALFSTCNAALQLLTTQPKTDVIEELTSILEDQFDIIRCMIESRHFGSDQLDDVIEICNEILEQVEEFEGK